MYKLLLEIAGEDFSKTRIIILDTDENDYYTVRNIIEVDSVYSHVRKAVKKYYSIFTPDTWVMDFNIAVAKMYVDSYRSVCDKELDGIITVAKRVIRIEKSVYSIKELFTMAYFIK